MTVPSPCFGSNGWMGGGCPAIYAAMQAASEPGVRAADLFALAQREWTERSVTDVWQKIHTGGGISYARREWITRASSAAMSQLGPLSPLPATA